MEHNNYPANLEELLVETVRQKGSDLHLTAGTPPLARIYGEIVELDYPKLMPEHIEALLMGVLSPDCQALLKREWELDFSHSISGLARFRGNAMFQRGSLSVALRVVPYEVPDIDSLGLPEAVKKLCFLSRGLVLVTGPTGSGKSTTISAMINLINEDRRLNIVTVEDPIEFLHTHKKSSIKQREVGNDTHSFANALRHVLRHDPDVILIGEMRDLESISIALSAAETGHLVLSTLHTQTAPLTVHRIVDAFQEYQREQVRKQLANTLRGVISQQLIPSIDGRGRVAAVEFMIDTAAVCNLIREGKEHQLYTAMQTGQSLGMQTLDQALARLVLAGKITRDMAFERCIDKLEMERMLQRPGAW